MFGDRLDLAQIPAVVYRFLTSTFPGCEGKFAISHTLARYNKLKLALGFPLWSVIERCGGPVSSHLGHGLYIKIIEYESLLKISLTRK